MIRVGMKIKDILNEAKSYDVVGITSIFTAQTKMVEEVVTSIKQNYCIRKKTELRNKEYI